MAPSYYSDYEATPSFGVKSSEKLKQAEPTTIACVSAMQIYKDTSYESCFESFCDPTRVGGSVLLFSSLYSRHHEHARHMHARQWR